MKDTYQILAEAADLLEQEGWCQNMLRNEHGNRCLAAVVAEVTALQGHVGYLEAWTAIEKEIGCYPPKNIFEAIDWNNTPGRTKEEVISTIRNAKRWINQEEG